MKILFPIRLHKRDRDMVDLIKSSAPVTSLDLLTMEYGHWPPKGVDAIPTRRLDQDFYIKSINEDPSATRKEKMISNLFCAGYVCLRNNSESSESLSRNLYLSTIWSSGAASALSQGVLLKAGYGVLKSLVSGSLISEMPQVPSFLLLAFALSSSRYLAAGHLFSIANPQTSPAFSSISEVVSHEHMHVLQGDDAIETFETNIGHSLHGRPFFTTALQVSEPLMSRRIIGALDSLLGLAQQHDLSCDDEVQARMHVVMMNGYRRWGKLPETRQELWASLIDSGLYAPQSIKLEVAQAKTSNPEIEKFIKRTNLFRLAASLTNDSSAELNTASAFHGGIGAKDYFWNVSLPYIYGHLIELYGDTNGRKKMGFSAEQSPEKIAENYFSLHPISSPREDITRYVKFVKNKALKHD